MNTNIINSFRGAYSFLSNFYPAEVTYEGITYQNNEAAFQAQKTLREDEKRSFTNLGPREAKRKGRRVALRDDWDRVKNHIMEELVRCKFTQNVELKRKLLATNHADLVEGNTWNDRYWGIDTRTGVGENHLGQILMKVRTELLNDQS